MGEKRGSMTTQQNQDGTWSQAKEEPYYPSIWEKIGHWFGIHQWTYPGVKLKKCVMCGEVKKD